MNYTELAKRFLHNSHQFKSYGHHQKIEESMQGEIFVLFYVSRQNNFTLPSEIGAEMNISSARVAAILNNLEKKGLITRQIDKSDRRKIIVELTKKGSEKAEKHNQTVISLTAQMLESLGEQDAKELVRITGRLAELAP
ncbi:MAG TPA: MarR family transcriptional regulator [Bacillota bacterium]|nr:MarR family transcriptional regulator [Bacillota bacterium]